ncbi:MAG: 30S ribosomal protein S7 [Bacillota bacterium]|nr:30S ribosomal protein S7 [Bacillota bacterium]
MPRRGQATRRQIEPDPVYGNETLSRLINKIMYSGKKSLAQRVVYDAVGIIEEKSKKNGVEVVETAIKNAMPVLEVRARRVGGATYQVPIEVRAERRMALALQWLVRYARERGERTMTEKLAGELLDAANNTGATIKRKEETHKMAEANRAFAHYKW